MSQTTAACDLLFINIDPAAAAAVNGALAVSDGRIIALGAAARALSAQAAQVIDCRGLWLLPGAVDAHTHVDLLAGGRRVCDGWSLGTAAALAGGATSIIEHISFDPDGSPLAALDAARARAEGNCCCDYGLHGVVQRLDENLPAVLQEQKRLGVASWKVYTTYDYAIAGAQLKQLLALCQQAGVLLTLHCEDDALLSQARQALVAQGRLSPRYHALARPAAAEALAVRAALQAAHELDDAPLYLVHLSTAAALDEVRRAREGGQQHIYAETCPQYMLLDDGEYQRGGAAALAAAISPPLRTAADAAAFWQGLADGCIDVLATDHCSFSWAQKDLGRDDFRLTPNGAPGVEERLTLLLSQGVAQGRISLARAVELLCGAPARIFGLPAKGRLDLGCDADLVLFDPTAHFCYQPQQLHGGAEYSLYQQLSLTGRVQRVWLRGRLAYADDQVKAAAGWGEYLRREL